MNPLQSLITKMEKEGKSLAEIHEALAASRKAYQPLTRRARKSAVGKATVLLKTAARPGGTSPQCKTCKNFARKGKLYCRACAKKAAS